VTRRIRLRLPCKSPRIRTIANYRCELLNYLAYRLKWAEIPLLAHNLPKWPFGIRRPTQNELLRARNFVFLKYER